MCAASIPAEDPPCQTPLVSICIPVYNGRAYLQKTIDAAINQDYPNLEIIIVDDASSDGSWDIANAFHDPRIKTYRNTGNLGPQDNWNRALQLANGDFVKLLHQDDGLDAACIKRQVEALQKSETCALAFCARKILNEKDRVIFQRTTRWKEGPIDRSTVLGACIRAGTNLIGEPSAVLFRRDAALKAGVFCGDIPYLIDLDYWLRLLMHGHAYCLPEPLAAFRISKSQWSSRLASRQYRDFCKFIDQLKSLPENRVGPFAVWRGKMVGLLNYMARMLIIRFYT